MGGRGSGGGRNSGGGGANKAKGEGITDKNELINLYNSISGNPSYTVEERVRAMGSIQEKIKEIDNAVIQKGAKIYNDKVKQNSYINMDEFNAVKEYLKENSTKKEILKLADHYGEVYENRFDRSGDSGAIFKTYELSLRKLADNIPKRKTKKKGV